MVEWWNLEAVLKVCCRGICEVQRGAKTNSLRAVKTGAVHGLGSGKLKLVAATGLGTEFAFYSAEYWLSQRQGCTKGCFLKLKSFEVVHVDVKLLQLFLPTCLVA